MDLFASRSEAASLMREIDWSASPLGPPDQWPQGLRTIIPIMLASRFGMRVLWGPEFIFLYNDAYRPVLGATKHPSAMGSRTRESFAEVWPIVGPLFERVRAGESVAMDDQQLPLLRNGYLEECYFTLSYSPVFDDDGSVGGVLGVVHETSARVLAERRLRTLRELSGVRRATVADACGALANVLARNPYDLPFAFIYVLGSEPPRVVEAYGLPTTHPLCDHRGWTSEAGLQVHVVDGDVYAGPYAEPIVEVVAVNVFDPRDVTPRVRLVLGINPRQRLDSTYRQFLGLVGDHVASAVAAALYDEERSSLLARANAAEAQLRSMFDEAPAAIAVLRGPDLVFELVNTRYCQLVGRHDLVGRPGRSALPELATQGVWDLLDRVFATGVPYFGREFPATLDRLGDGRLDAGYFDFTAQPLHGHDGSVIGLTIFAIEITEQVTLRKAEADARAQAEKASVAKDEFLAIVSHELRNPLSAILGWTRMLRTGVLPAAKQAHALETVERNAVNQSQLIDDLLDVSRIVSGKLTLDVKQLSFSEVVTAAIDSARPAIDAKQLRLRAIVDDVPVVLMGDATRLQQVVWNLLTNAIKFTPKGGSITVHLVRVESSLELSVTDTGKGMVADLLPYVFERFKQGDSTTTRSHGGLGLGLAISRSIVEMHGGTIEAHSDGENRGSRFSVRLPIAPVRATPPTAELAGSWQPTTDLQGLRILVVDDEVDGREVIAFVLERSGAIVSRAGSVAEAFALFRQDRPHIVLSDIGMPGEDGYSLISRIRALPTDQGGATPAASLTAYASVEDRKRALLAGFDMHVPKPVDPAELVAVASNLGRLARALR